LFLALWLALFSVQSADIVALVAPDDCFDVGQSDDRQDPCPDFCPRCVCCVRIAVSPSFGPRIGIEPPTIAVVPVVLDSFTNPQPRVIFHVPKTS
jgi:hypothetical protein